MQANELILKGAISTDSLNAGLLTPEQAKTFLKNAVEKTVLLQQARPLLRSAKTGEIDKIGIGRRILRAKTEGIDDNYRAGVDTSKVEYATQAVRLPWEINEESLRQNIEGENFEDIVAGLMEQAVGVDLEDLCLNSDTATAESNVDYPFLKLNDGWLKLIGASGHVEDRTSKSSGSMILDVFYDALAQMPDKYNDGSLRWYMSPSRKQIWDKYLLNQMIAQGGAITSDIMNNPASIPAVAVPRMPKSQIILTNPKNLIVVNTYDMKIRKTTEGREAIMQDKRFYVIHFDFDPIIEETDATVLIKGLA